VQGHAFQPQAARERQKAKDLGNLLVMLVEYRRKREKALKNGEEWNPSRMEPMESYDEADIRTQRAGFIDSARDMEQMALNCEKIADNAKKTIIEIQRKLRAQKDE